MKGEKKTSEIQAIGTTGSAVLIDACRLQGC